MLAAWLVLAAAPTPAAPFVHSHNDYRRKRPVVEALEAGAGSLEADVFPADGRLLVGHDRPELRPDRTLESVFLGPLAAHLEKRPARPGDGPIWLLIDVKADGPAAYDLLHAAVEAHPELFAPRGDLPSAVRIVLSGALAGEAGRAVVRRRPAPWAGIDGRLTDLDRPEDPLAPMPWISDNWLREVRWLGVGGVPSEEYRKLRDYARRAEMQGRRLRFWGAPDTPAVWRAQVEAGVHIIGTDRPAAAVAEVAATRRRAGAAGPPR